MYRYKRVDHSGEHLEYRTVGRDGLATLHIQYRIEDVCARVERLKSQLLIDLHTTVTDVGGVGRQDAEYLHFVRHRICRNYKCAVSRCRSNQLDV